MSESSDRFVRRSRPMFLYVVYIMILASVPMGILGAFKPDMAKSIADSAGLWLKAIPDSMWALFGVGYTVYTGARSFDKKQGVSK